MKKNIISIGLIIIAVVSGSCFLIFGNELSLIFRILLKIIPTLTMCLWMLIKLVDKTNWPIFVGLLLSMVCDIFMALTGNMFLVGGILSNMLALIFYALYFYRSDTRIELFRALPIFVVMGIFYFVLFDFLGNYKIPVAVYCLIYIVFMWRATARLGDKSISKYSQQVCFLGSILVTVSDCLLSFVLFNVLSDKAKYHYMVMILWWSGLFMLMITAEIKRKSINRIVG
jgi:alkenylglycerophosphocholine/alkenylglycerophosphoethanolamine hydrolase